MFCQLGHIRFERSTYFTGMETTKGYGFAEHARVASKPTLQGVGDPLDALTLDMRLHASWCDPAAVAEQVVSAAERKEAMALTMGDGTYRGRFVVTEIVATNHHHTPDGAVLWMDLRLSLKEWVDDEPLATAKRQRIAQSPARKSASNPTVAKAQKGTPAFTLAQTTSKDGFSVNKIVRKE